MPERPVGRLDYGCVRRRVWTRVDASGVGSVFAFDRDHGVVDGRRYVGHVDQPFVLKCAGGDDRVLRNLVPLLHDIAWRQRRGRWLR